jgi:hypothetical protein
MQDERRVGLIDMVALVDKHRWIQGGAVDRHGDQRTKLVRLHASAVHRLACAPQTRNDVCGFPCNVCWCQQAHMIR